MRELPEPDLGFAHKSYSPELVLAIQRQAYEDGLRDAKKFFTDNGDLMFWGSQAAKHIADMLTASQKEQK